MQPLPVALFDPLSAASTTAGHFVLDSVLGIVIGVVVALSLLLLGRVADSGPPDDRDGSVRSGPGRPASPSV